MPLLNRREPKEQLVRRQEQTLQHHLPLPCHKGGDWVLFEGPEEDLETHKILRRYLIDDRYWVYILSASNGLDLEHGRRFREYELRARPKEWTRARNGPLHCYRVGDQVHFQMFWGERRSCGDGPKFTIVQMKLGDKGGWMYQLEDSIGRSLEEGT